MFAACGIHIIILGRIVMNFLNRFFDFQSLNFFLSFLIFYELINVFRYLALILNFESGVVSSYIGGVSEFLFAILFAFININTKEYSFQSKLK